MKSTCPGRLIFPSWPSITAQKPYFSIRSFTVIIVIDYRFVFWLAFWFVSRTSCSASRDQDVLGTVYSDRRNVTPTWLKSTPTSNPGLLPEHFKRNKSWSLNPSMDPIQTGQWTPIEEFQLLEALNLVFGVLDGLVKGSENKNVDCPGSSWTSLYLLSSSVLLEFVNTTSGLLCERWHKMLVCFETFLHLDTSFFP